MNNEQGNSIPLVSIGIPVKDGFKNKSSALICNRLHPLNASMLKNIINKYKNIIIL